MRARVLRLFRHRDLLSPDDARCTSGGTAEGGSLKVRIEARDRAGLERVLRYCARPILCQRKPGPGSGPAGRAEDTTFALGIERRAGGLLTPQTRAPRPNHPRAHASGILGASGDANPTPAPSPASVSRRARPDRTAEQRKRCNRVLLRAPFALTSVKTLQRQPVAGPHVPLGGGQCRAAAPEPHAVVGPAKASHGGSSWERQQDFASSSEGNAN